MAFLYEMLKPFPFSEKLQKLCIPHSGINLQFGSTAFIHSDKKILIQNIKTVSSVRNAQTVWLVVYKYTEKNILSKQLF